MVPVFDSVGPAEDIASFEEHFGFLLRKKSTHFANSPSCGYSMEYLRFAQSKIHQNRRLKADFLQTQRRRRSKYKSDR
jgi:hypothetical protein